MNRHMTWGDRQADAARQKNLERLKKLAAMAAPEDVSAESEAAKQAPPQAGKAAKKSGSAAKPAKSAAKKPAPAAAKKSAKKTGKK